MTQEQKHGHRDRRPHDRLDAEQPERVGRREDRRHQRRERRNAKKNCDDEPSRECCHPKPCVVAKQHTRGGRNPLAAEKAMEDRIEMADKGCKSRKGNDEAGRDVVAMIAFASSTATNPLPASPTSVSTAAALLPVRSTLVAPGLFEP